MVAKDRHALNQCKTGTLMEKKDTVTLCPLQTSYFILVKSNANEGEQRIFIICIRFGSCKVRRLNLALAVDIGKLGLLREPIKIKNSPFHLR